MIQLSKTDLFFVILITTLITSVLWFIAYDNLSKDNNDLQILNSELISNNSILKGDIIELEKSYQEFKDNVEYTVDENHIAITIAYLTNFSQNQQSIR